VPGMGANYQNARSLTELTAATVAERQGGTRKGKLKEAEGKPTTAGTRTDREACHGRRACKETQSPKAVKETWRVESGGASGKIAHLTRGDPARESERGVSRGHSSDDTR
jgi:hypothetical protein